MADQQDKIDRLLRQLDNLASKQEAFNQELEGIRESIRQLREGEESGQQPVSPPKMEPAQPAAPVNSPPASSILNVQDEKKPNQVAAFSVPTAETAKPKKLEKSDLEKFIGENLINKIGIAITVIGVAIGAKYAIDHQLISPLTRIILGYLIGGGLLGFAIKLKRNYDNFSAVLLSGSMAIMYFLTYTAYSLYGLMPQLAAFGIMLVFTAFTALAAINYNRPVIAHIGLVGAYAIPFLLSENSGKYAMLFSYMAVINSGILIIAFKKYWKSLYYAAFVLTWLIYIPWYFLEYRVNDHFGMALGFLTTFFIIFYVTFIAYKMVRKEKFVIGDIVILLLNSFIFYGLGYSMLVSYPQGDELLGVFTLCNAVVHFAVSMIIYRRKMADRSLFFLVSGLVLVFITMAFPVQMDGNWVTMLWAGEAALLFWIGRTKSVSVYEVLSYPVMLLAFWSIFHDWMNSYGVYRYSQPDSTITPILNINFLTSMLLVGAYGFINWLNSSKKYTSPLAGRPELATVMSYVLPGLLMLILYFSFRMEIHSYWTQKYFTSEMPVYHDGNIYDYARNSDLLQFNRIWIINYTLLFMTLLSFANLLKLRKASFAWVNISMNLLAILTFLTAGLYALSELRVSYLYTGEQIYFEKGSFYLSIRYVSFIFLGGLFYACYRYMKDNLVKSNLKMGFDLLLHTTLIWVISSELLHWMDIYGSGQAYKLGLSILWGSYSLLLIVIGIVRRKKYLRIGAISFFGVTLLKLFLYDISHLNTISKTIVFVSLGILLLVISFLYNKYKHLIFDETQE